MKTKAILMVMIALMGIYIFAPIVNAETVEEWNEKGVQVNATSSNMMTYTSEEYGFSIGFFEDWSVRPNYLGEAVVFEGPQLDGYIINVGIKTEELQTAIPLEEYVNVSGKTLETTCLTHHIDEEYSTTINGEPAVIGVYSWTVAKDIPEFKGKVAFFVKNTTAYTILCGAMPSAYNEANENYFEPMIQSFKFIPTFAPIVNAETAEEWNEKVEDYNKAIVLNPYDAEAYFSRGLTYSHLEEYERAIEDYSKAIVLNPKYAVAYYNRGLTYDILYQYERAIEDYSKAIELDPKYAVAYTNRGVVYDDLEQYKRAIEDYNKALELDPNDILAYNGRGLTYSHLKEYERAIEDYSKAIELDPKYAVAYNNRGIVYDILGQYERAIEDYNKAIELDPNYVNAYYNRGIAYYDLMQYERAIEDYNKAIE
ncbi:MAG: tetratricopeptide repeat protein, partial [Methanophagales archaeon]|nr:tetratricopeptide repeat protein [Methanophagales archaeon]